MTYFDDSKILAKSFLENKGNLTTIGEIF